MARCRLGSASSYRRSNLTDHALSAESQVSNPCLNSGSGLPSDSTPEQRQNVAWPGLISSEITVNKGPHPDLDSDFTLFCEVISEALT